MMWMSGGLAQDQSLSMCLKGHDADNSAGASCQHSCTLLLMCAGMS